MEVGTRVAIYTSISDEKIVGEIDRFMEEGIDIKLEKDWWFDGSDTIPAGEDVSIEWDVISAIEMDFEDDAEFEYDEELEDDMSDF